MPRTRYDLTDCDLDARRDEPEEPCDDCGDALPERGSPFCADCAPYHDEEE